MGTHLGPATETTREDRAVGALLGLAVGDAVGTALEFKEPGTFRPITDMVGGGPFGLAPGQWTDDTSMALCLAESLLDQGMDPADQLRRYVLWRREGYFSSTGRCFDIGITTARALDRFERTGELEDSEPAAAIASNGSLMRLAPVSIRWFDDPAIAAVNAAASSKTTHAARASVDACRVLAAMTAAFIKGFNASNIWTETASRFGLDDLHPEVAAVANGSWMSKQPPEIRGSSSAVEALEAALWAVGGAADFRDAILRAANLGDDADTTAAIAGQLAGAQWGLQGIPAEWREHLTMGPRVMTLARKLFEGPATKRPLFTNSYPGHVDRQRAVDRITELVDEGYRTFVDLTTPDDDLPAYEDIVNEIEGQRRVGLRRIAFPIPDHDVIADDSYDEVLAVIDGANAAYVHCAGDGGRAGTVLAASRVKTGRGYRHVMDRIDPSPMSDSQVALVGRLSARGSEAWVEAVVAKAVVRAGKGDEPAFVATELMNELAANTGGWRDSDTGLQMTEAFVGHALPLVASAAIALEFREAVTRSLDWLLADRRQANANMHKRAHVAELFRVGDVRDATTAALQALHDIRPGDDRCEQDLVVMLDDLRMDEAIIEGYAVLRDRRRELRANGHEPYQHAIFSWTDAMRRIIDQGGPLASEANARLAEPFWGKPAPRKLPELALSRIETVPDPDDRTKLLLRFPDVNPGETREIAMHAEFFIQFAYQLWNAGQPGADYLDYLIDIPRGGLWLFKDPDSGRDLAHQAEALIDIYYDRADASGNYIEEQIADAYARAQRRQAQTAD